MLRGGWRRSRMVCFDFLNGVCSRGDNCKFAHKSEWKPKKICRDIRLNGTCTRGEKCVFSHDLEAYKIKRGKEKERQANVLRKKREQRTRKQSRLESLTSEALQITQKKKRVKEAFSKMQEEDIVGEGDNEQVQLTRSLELTAEDVKMGKSETFLQKLKETLEQTKTTSKPV
ncbi:hypothetical protein AAMO2058_000886200 [Amorphochlora amoebiformis]